jgi:hypothetical protein
MIQNGSWRQIRLGFITTHARTLSNTHRKLENVLPSHDVLKNPRIKLRKQRVLKKSKLWIGHFGTVVFVSCTQQYIYVKDMRCLSDANSRYTCQRFPTASLTRSKHVNYLNLTDIWIQTNLHIKFKTRFNIILHIRLNLQAIYYPNELQINFYLIFIRAT